MATSARRRRCSPAAEAAWVEMLECRILLYGTSSSTGGEIQELLQLVEEHHATHRAVAEGGWSDAATWDGGVLPGAQARVLIPHGVTVTVDDEHDGTTLDWIRVDGTLTFQTNVNTSLLVDTIVVQFDGQLEVGTRSDPIQHGVTARVTFAGQEAIDPADDPYQLGRGLISAGFVSIVGQEKTNFVTLNGAAEVGSTQIRVAGNPVGWQVGDTIVIAGTGQTSPPGTAPDWEARTAQAMALDHVEERVITAINGNTIHFAERLQYSHSTPRPDFDVYVSNITRNVVFRSQSTESPMQNT